MALKSAALVLDNARRVYGMPCVAPGMATAAHWQVNAGMLREAGSECKREHTFAQSVPIQWLFGTSPPQFDSSQPQPCNQLPSGARPAHLAKSVHQSIFRAAGLHRQL